jgi:hypothetical protein
VVLDPGDGGRKAMRTLRRVRLWIGGCVLAAAAPIAVAQMGSMPGSDPHFEGSRPQPIPPDVGSPDGKLEHDQAKLRYADRQKQLVADTQKLVTLANELKSDVEKSNKDTLSVDVIRKADEIEKLAKSVREKMKGT